MRESLKKILRKGKILLGFSPRNFGIKRFRINPQRHVPHRRRQEGILTPRSIYSDPPCANPRPKIKVASEFIFKPLKLEIMERHEEIIERSKVAEVELVYRSKVRPSERPTVKNARDAYRIFMKHWDPGKIELQEQFKVLYLNMAGKVLGVDDLSNGGMTGTSVDPKLLFAMALKITAVSFIMAHNHPSGNLTPSKGDEALTQQIKQGGEILTITLLDHLIVTADGFYSFREQGLL